MIERARTEFEQSILERLESYHRHEGDCFIWTRSIHPDGYGMMKVAERVWLTHRLMWMLRRGPIPDEICILHRCDVRRCANIDHLFLGTRAENNADRDSKGRSRGGALAGIHNPQARLTEADVLAIFASRRPAAELARNFGVSVSQISNIRLGKAWSRVTGPWSQEVPVS